GNEVPVSSVTIIYKSPDGQPQYIATIARDITERKKSEEKIIKSEEQYRDLVNNITDLICTHDLEGTILSVNSAAEKLSGFKFDSERIMNIKDLLISEQKNKFDYYIKDIKKNGFVKGIMKVKTRNGAIQIWEYNNSLKTTGNGRPIVRGYAKDVTESFNAIKKIKFDANLLKAVGQGVIATDIEGHINYWNNAAERKYGWSAAEAMGKNIFDLTESWQSKEMGNEILSELRKGNLWNGELVVQRKDKTVFPALISNSPIFNDKGEVIGIIGVSVDITQRKEEELKLKQLSQAVEQSTASVIITDPEGNIQYVNQKFTELTGYTSEEVMGKNPRMLKSGYTLATEYEKLWKNISSGKEWCGELYNVKKNGEFFWEWAIISPVINDKGEIINFLAIKEDITERKKAETALLESEETFRSLFNESTDPVLLLDDTGFFDCNESAVSILKYSSRQEVLNKKPWDISPEKQPDGSLSTEKAEAMIAIARKQGNTQFEWVHIKSDGTRFIVDVMLTSILLKGKQIFYTHWRDISSRKRAEEDLKLLEGKILEQKIQVQKKIARAMIKAQEPERSHMGQELHDNINQILAGTKLYLSM
ncbi:MAG: PAS domain S-box protein, partial [Bacteroidia bacterium]|nr:PAS domain S-box protein [Bacteroidia bacterium]